MWNVKYKLISFVVTYYRLLAFSIRLNHWFIEGIYGKNWNLKTEKLVSEKQLWEQLCSPMRPIQTSPGIKLKKCTDKLD